MIESGRFFKYTLKPTSHVYTRYYQAVALLLFRNLDNTFNSKHSNSGLDASEKRR